MSDDQRRRRGLTVTTARRRDPVGRDRSQGSVRAGSRAGATGALRRRQGQRAASGQGASLPGQPDSQWTRLTEHRQRHVRPRPGVTTSRGRGVAPDQSGQHGVGIRGRAERRNRSHSQRRRVERRWTADRPLGHRSARSSDRRPGGFDTAAARFSSRPSVPGSPAPVYDRRGAANPAARGRHPEAAGRGGKVHRCGRASQPVRPNPESDDLRAGGACGPRYSAPTASSSLSSASRSRRASLPQRR